MKVYLDTNILVAYYAKDKAEKDKKKMICEALEIFAESKDANLYTSMWAIAEMVNVLRFRKRMRPSTVMEIENDLINERRLQGIKIQLVEVSPRKDYDFQEFFYHVRQGILKYHSGVGDIIHSVIMKNNNINVILTFDDKDDFKEIPNLLVLHPRITKIEK